MHKLAEKYGHWDDVLSIHEQNGWGNDRLQGRAVETALAPQEMSTSSSQHSYVALLSNTTYPTIPTRTYQTKKMGVVGTSPLKNPRMLEKQQRYLSCTDFKSAIMN